MSLLTVTVICHTLSVSARRLAQRRELYVVPNDMLCLPQQRLARGGVQGDKSAPQRCFTA